MSPPRYYQPGTVGEQPSRPSGVPRNTPPRPAVPEALLAPAMRIGEQPSRDSGVPRNTPPRPALPPVRSIGEQPSSGSNIKRNAGTSFQMSVPAPAPPPPAASQFAPAESSASAEAQERGTKRTRPSEPASAPAPARAPAPAPAPPAPVVPNLAPIAPPTRLSSGPGKGKGKRPLNGFANKTAQSVPGWQQSFPAPISSGIAFQQFTSQQAAPAPSYSGNHAQQSFQQQVASAPGHNSRSIQQSVPQQLPMTPAHNGFQDQLSQLQQFAQRAVSAQHASPRQYPWTRLRQTQQNGALGYTNPYTPTHRTTNYSGSYPLTPPPSPLTPKKLNPLSCKREKTKKTTKEVYRVIQLKQGKKRFGKVEPKRRKQDEKNDILNRFEKQIEYREAAVGRMDCRSDYLGFGRRDVYGKLLCTRL
ncbi:hypothetical protein GLAREA_02111 [Glarea lozoyensis ATCC 20868]|uniref:Uncharacterized protein n=1 Tax=Glarea lozoyensis (strain ATCC 20868 / MF5171) TaxID=1116229 RepID=S3CLX6_GLAL2|nr:uncharacterized protein GLAREA_02111 [Glarea lozoyensis ATCC 20868]EPE26199.1 hypothetical protein GLAREA_02111 [Glarea lozoyensis ATCC 20868]